MQRTTACKGLHKVFHWIYKLTCDNMPRNQHVACHHITNIDSISFHTQRNTWQPWSKSNPTPREYCLMKYAVTVPRTEEINILETCTCSEVNSEGRSLQRALLTDTRREEYLSDSRENLIWFLSTCVVEAADCAGWKVWFQLQLCGDWAVAKILSQSRLRRAIRRAVPAGKKTNFIYLSK